jgi:hypothetical protein
MNSWIDREGVEKHILKWIKEGAGPREIEHGAGGGGSGRRPARSWSCSVDEVGDRRGQPASGGRCVCQPAVGRERESRTRTWPWRSTRRLAIPPVGNWPVSNRIGLPGQVLLENEF